MMSDEYTEAFQRFSKNYQTEAASFFSFEEMTNHLQEEQKIFQNAETFEIPISHFAGNNADRYVKDLIRRRQPLFLLYVLMNLLVEISSLLFVWMFAKSCFFFLMHHTNAFSATYSLRFSPAIIFGIFLTQDIQKNDCHQKLAKGKKPSTFFLWIFFGIWCLISCGILVLFPFIRFPQTLLQSFLFFLGMLLLAGIHNVIYSSHLLAFAQIQRFLFFTKNVEKAEEAKAHYLCLCLIQYMAQGCFEKNKDLPNDIDTWILDDFDTAAKQAVRKKIVSNRAYCFLAAAITIPFTILCLLPLFHHIFTAAIVFFILFLCLSILFINGIMIDHFLLKKIDNH